MRAKFDSFWTMFLAMAWFYVALHVLAMMGQPNAMALVKIIWGFLG